MWCVTCDVSCATRMFHVTVWHDTWQCVTYLIKMSLLARFRVALCCVCVNMSLLCVLIGLVCVWIHLVCVWIHLVCISMCLFCVVIHLSKPASSVAQKHDVSYSIRVTWSVLCVRAMTHDKACGASFICCRWRDFKPAASNGAPFEYINWKSIQVFCLEIIHTCAYIYDSDSYIDLFCSTTIFRYVTPYFATDLCHGGALHQSYSVEIETETSDAPPEAEKFILFDNHFQIPHLGFISFLQKFVTDFYGTPQHRAYCVETGTSDEPPGAEKTPKNLKLVGVAVGFRTKFSSSAGRPSTRSATVQDILLGPGRAATERFIAQLPRAHWIGPKSSVTYCRVAKTHRMTLLNRSCSAKERWV